MQFGRSKSAEEDQRRNRDWWNGKCPSFRDLESPFMQEGVIKRNRPYFEVNSFVSENEVYLSRKWGWRWKIVFRVIFFRLETPCSLPNTEQSRPVKSRDLNVYWSKQKPTYPTVGPRIQKHCFPNLSRFPPIWLIILPTNYHPLPKLLLSIVPNKSRAPIWDCCEKRAHYAVIELF